MGLFDKIKEKLSHEFIDIIEWLDYTQDTIAHRFERYQNEIKNNERCLQSHFVNIKTFGLGKTCLLFLS